jgi:hypothetical protein
MTPICVCTFLRPNQNILFFSYTSNARAFYLGILTIYHPRVNIATFRVTSIAGTVAGIMNILVNFFMAPSIYWWNGVLHIPLIVISIYGLILSLRKIAAS